MPLEIIGVYDCRTAIGTMPSSVAHAIAKKSKKKAAQPKLETVQAFAKERGFELVPMSTAFSKRPVYALTKDSQYQFQIGRKELADVLFYLEDKQVINNVA